MKRQKKLFYLSKNDSVLIIFKWHHPGALQELMHNWPIGSSAQLYKNGYFVGSEISIFQLDFQNRHMQGNLDKKVNLAPKIQ